MDKSGESKIKYHLKYLQGVIFHILIIIVNFFSSENVLIDENSLLTSASLKKNQFSIETLFCSKE